MKNTKENQSLSIYWVLLLEQRFGMNPLAIGYYSTLYGKGRGVCLSQ